MRAAARNELERKGQDGFVKPKEAVGLVSQQPTEHVHAPKPWI